MQKLLYVTAERRSKTAQLPPQGAYTPTEQHGTTRALPSSSLRPSSREWTRSVQLREPTGLALLSGTWATRGFQAQLCSLEPLQMLLLLTLLQTVSLTRQGRRPRCVKPRVLEAAHSFSPSAGEGVLIQKGALRKNNISLSICLVLKSMKLLPKPWLGFLPLFTLNVGIFYE